MVIATREPPYGLQRRPWYRPREAPNAYSVSSQQSSQMRIGSAKPVLVARQVVGRKAFGHLAAFRYVNCRARSLMTVRHYVCGWWSGGGHPNKSRGSVEGLWILLSSSSDSEGGS